MQTTLLRNRRNRTTQRQAAKPADRKSPLFYSHGIPGTSGVGVRITMGAPVGRKLRLVFMGEAPPGTRLP